jgi:hypothetical protein
LVIALFAIALLVGVFNTKHESSARVSGVGPVKERGADKSHVWRPGGRGAKAHSHIRAGRFGEEVGH